MGQLPANGVPESNQNPRLPPQGVDSNRTLCGPLYHTHPVNSSASEVIRITLPVISLHIPQKWTHAAYLMLGIDPEPSGRVGIVYNDKWPARLVLSQIAKQTQEVSNLQRAGRLLAVRFHDAVNFRLLARLHIHQSLVDRVGYAEPRHKGCLMLPDPEHTTERLLLCRVVPPRIHHDYS